MNRLCIFATFLVAIVSRADACIIDAYSLNQPRSFQINFRLYVDGQADSIFRIEQPFRVDYEAIIEAPRNAPSIARLTIRPQEMLEPAVLETIFGDIPATVRISPPFELPPWLEPVPPDYVLIDVSLDVLGGVSIGTQFFLNRNRVTGDLNQDRSVRIRGPFADPRDESDWRYIGVPLSQFALAATNWGWTEATVPLSADDYLCRGDFNADGVVDQRDLDLILLNWGMPPPDEWTRNRPDFVRQLSLDSVLIAWGDVAPLTATGSAGVPEPSTMALFVIMCLGMLCGRRKE